MVEYISLKRQYQVLEKSIQESIKRVLSHGQYVMGPEVFELEKRLSEFVGVKHCITTSSGTDALLMSKMALNIKPGDEVILPAFTWVATAETIILLGATPVFVDIDEDTFCIDTNQIEKCINEKTKAIIPVSLFGQMADLFQINKIAEEYNIPVIEDAAQSFGAQYKDRKSCSLSTIACTSFFPAKPLGCYGDGGACFTDEDELAEKLQWIRVHGQKSKGDVKTIGINGRLDTIQAAILLEKLRIFPEEIIKRQRVANMYSELISSKNIIKPIIAPDNSSVFALYTIRSKRRDFLKEKLHDNGIPTAIYYKNSLFDYSVYQKYGKCPLGIPVTQRFKNEVLSLPIHPYLDQSDLLKISQLINNE